MRERCPDCSEKHEVMDSLPKRPITLSEFQFVANNDKFGECRTDNWMFDMTGDEPVGRTKRVLLEINEKVVSATYFEELEEWLITQEWDLTEKVTKAEETDNSKIDIIDTAITDMTAAQLRCVQNWDALGRPGMKTEVSQQVILHS